VTDPISDDYEVIEQKAAVLGYFDPKALVADTNDITLQRRLLGALGERCEEIKINNDYYWQMTPRDRRSVLSSLVVDEKSQTWLTELRSSVIEGDAFGRYLVDVLLGSYMQTSKTSIESANTLLHVLQFVGDTSLGSELDQYADLRELTESQLQREIGLRSVQSMLKLTLPKKLYGRARELRRLKTFIKLEVPSGRPQVFLLTGVGGVGKSALVSEFIRVQRKTKNTAPVVYLDCDRASLEFGDVDAFTLEFARQLSLFDSSIDTAIATFLRTMEYESSDVTSNLEAISQQSSLALYELNSALANWGHLRSPIVVIIDTFEEISMRGLSVCEHLFRWLGDLADIGGFENLRVVVTGRDVPSEQLQWDFLQLVESHELTDLSIVSSAALLRRIGVDKTMSSRAAKVLGGNPLVLQMFARFLDESPDDGESLLVEAETQQHEGGKGRPVGAVAVEFLYDRILRRIRDPRVKSLASPGLVLRRVTPEIIKYVLSEPCELEINSIEEARLLFEILSTNVWLVRSVGDNVLEHRRDVRGMMLNGIKEKDVAKWNLIHKSASQFYYNLHNSNASPDDFDPWLEYVYHSGFLDQLPDVEPQSAELLLTQLGSGLEDWPVEIRAKLKDLAHDDHISSDEIDTLPSEKRKRAFSRKAAVSSSLGDFNRSNEALEQVDLDDPSMLRVLYNNGELERAAAVAPASLERYWSSGDIEPNRSLLKNSEFLHNIPWMAVCASLTLSRRRVLFTSRVLDKLIDLPSRYFAHKLVALGFAYIVGERRAISILYKNLRLDKEMYTHKAFPSSIAGGGAFSVVATALSSNPLRKDLLGRDGLKYVGLDCFNYRGLRTLPEYIHISGKSSNIPMLLREVDSWQEKQPSIREMRTIYKLLSKSRFFSSRLEKPLGPILRLPQVHGPLGAALRKDMNDDILFDVLNSMGITERAWPYNYLPDYLADRKRRPLVKYVISDIIEIADMLGCLTSFINECRKSLPLSESLKQLHLLTKRLENGGVTPKRIAIKPGVKTRRRQN